MIKYEDFDMKVPRKNKNDSLGWGVASLIVALGFSLFVINHQTKLKKLGFADDKNPLNLHEEKVSRVDYDKIIKKLEISQRLLSSSQSENQMMKAKILNYELNEKSALVYMRRFQYERSKADEWREKYEQRTKNFDYLYNDYMDLQTQYLEKKHSGEETVELIVANQALKQQISKLRSQTALSWKEMDKKKEHVLNAPPDAHPKVIPVASVATMRTLKDTSNQILIEWKNWKRISRVVKRKPYIIPRSNNKLVQDILNYADKKAYADKLAISNSPIAKNPTRNIASAKIDKSTESVDVLADDSQMREWKKFLVDRDRKKYDGMRAVFNNVEMKSVNTKRVPASVKAKNVSLFDIKKYKKLRKEFNSFKPERKPANTQTVLKADVKNYQQMRTQYNRAKVSRSPSSNNLKISKPVQEKGIQVDNAVKTVKAKTSVKKMSPIKSLDEKVVFHIIKKGESLMTISKKYYNTHQKYKLILKSNPELDGMNLVTGDKIKITNVERERVVWIDGEWSPPGSILIEQFLLSLVSNFITQPRSKGICICQGCI